MSQGSSSDQNRHGETVSKSIESNSSKDREELLRQVIETTFSASIQGLSEKEWESLRRVVESNPNSPQLDLGLVCQLVKSLIETRFSTLAQDQAMLQRMCLRISGTLWSHPASNGRLRRFWELLLGQVR
jgi:hypothetical protein